MYVSTPGSVLDSVLDSVNGMFHKRLRPCGPSGESTVRPACHCVSACNRPCLAVCLLLDTVTDSVNGAFDKWHLS